MPEKVYTKFGEDKPRSEAAQVAVPNGSVKRLRDGSPKVSGSDAKSKASQAPQSKKQKTNDLAPSPAPKSSSYNDVPNQRGTFFQGKGKNNEHVRSQVPNVQASRTAQALLKSRMELPVWQKRQDIKFYLRSNDVLLLRGETGSGKSTQTPQFLHTEPWCMRKSVKIKNKDGIEEAVSVGGMIAITQPRRVAAITLAQRVAREMGCSVEKGTKHGSVGYSVRFDTVMPAGTKIKFLTEGMLLQEMLRDPHLRKYSCVIVDEIHERSVDVDLIAGFLRILLHGDKKGRGGIPLKVVIMSATLDTGGLEAFFAKPGTEPYEPGETHGKTHTKNLLRWQHLEEKQQATEDKIQSVDNKQKPSEGQKKKAKRDGDDKRNSRDSFSSWSGFGTTDSSETGSSPVKKDLDAPGGNSIHESSISAKEMSTPIAGTPNRKNSDSSKSIPSPNLSEATSEEYEEVPTGRAKNGVAKLFVQGRQYEVKTFYDVVPTPDYLDNMLRTVMKLHVTEPLPGDILCFLTGQEEIETLKTQLEHFAAQVKPDLPRMKVLPLYGSLGPMAQQEAFEKVKEKRTRKVVLATNIAETSVTVSGVRIVVDCGKSKIKQFRPRLGIESLLSHPISMVSAVQRQGRAGREGPGKCIKLYTAEDEDKLEPDSKPEILRSDVVEAVLKMKARGVVDVLNFPLMDRPSVVATEKALLQLHVMGAIDDHGAITPDGMQIASYPLPANYGRVLLGAARADCLLAAIDIIACLTSDAEIYLQAKSEEQQVAMEEHRKLIQNPKGDLLTYLNTIRAYALENTDRNAWCARHMISTRAMKMAMMIRKQLRLTCQKQNLLKEAPPPDPQPYTVLKPEEEDALLKAFVQAFVTKTAILGKDGTYVTTVGRNVVGIHPGSTLYGKKVEAILFLEHVFTAKSWGRRVSVVQADWIESALIGET